MPAINRHGPRHHEFGGNLLIEIAKELLRAVLTVVSMLVALRIYESMDEWY